MAPLALSTGRASGHAPWGEVLLLGGAGASDQSWKRDSTRFLQETFGFVKVRDYDDYAAAAAASSFSAAPLHAQPSTLVLCFTGAADRCLGALVEAGALVGTGAKVVLVVDDVDAARGSPAASPPILPAEVPELNAARARLRGLAGRHASGCSAVVVGNMLAAQFKVIDLLSPLSSPAGRDSGAGAGQQQQQQQQQQQL